MKFLLGLFTGVALGMLLAPDEGAKTRKKINDNWPNYKKQVKDSFDKTKEAIDNTFKTGTKELPQEKPLAR